MAVPPAIDGKVEEAEWRSAATFSGMVGEFDRQPSPEGAVFFLAYDDDYVYFAAKLADRQPSSIRAVEYRTNVGMPGDDNVGIWLDPTGQLNGFNGFRINPKGATSIDLAGGRAAKREWTGEFVAKTRITEQGWEVEARIPWQLMQLPGAGKRNLRFNVGRFIPRLDRYYTYVFTNDGQQANTPYWTDVVLPKPVVDRRIKLLPYVYAGHDPAEGAIFNSGLDLKTQVADQITLVGTVNPDFRNIENEILSLDFSRFERIAEESRPFFQEGSDYIRNRLFASQRIQGFDTGISVYGRMDDRTTFGVLDTIDFGHENAFVANVEHNPNQYSEVEFATTNYDRRGRGNSAYMLAGNRQFGKWNVFGRSMHSQDSQVGYGRSHNLGFGFNQIGFNTWASYNWVEENFRPALGFFPETNFKGFNLGFERFRNYNRGFLSDFGMFFSMNRAWRLDGRRYRDGFNNGFFATLRNRIGLNFFVSQGTFEDQKDKTYSVGIGYPNNSPYSNVGLSYGWGEIAGMDLRSIGFNANYRILRGLQLSFDHQEYELGEVARQSILGLNYDLGRDRTVSGRAVARDGEANWYLSFRQSGNRGLEYYLIFGDPNAPRFRESIIVKVVFPLEVGANPAPRRKTVLSG